jgi:4-hydroxybenzoate polyprenyltransferase
MACYTVRAPITMAWTYLGFFLVASQVFHAAGCVIDDMWDKNIDAATARTRKRPLAAGDLSRFQAFMSLVPQLALGVWMFMQLNQFSTIFGLSSLVLVVLYPAMKRVIAYPQAVLAVCFNWGALLGAASIAGAIDWRVYIPLYMGAGCWTVEYDTLCALTDRDDDIKNGINSATIIFGDWVKHILFMFTFVACSLVTYAGILNEHGFLFFIGVALGALHVVRLLATIDIENMKSLEASLLNNAWFGFWIWAGAMADYVVTML